MLHEGMAMHVFLLMLLFLHIKPSVIRTAGAHDVICIAKERQALLKFQQGLVDDSGQLISWGTRDCCTWRGVLCNNLTAHVVSLDLHRQDFSFDLPLTGNISTSLLELQHLNYLDLGGNNFGDGQNKIPEFIGSLGDLQFLDLADNSFIGEIPHSLRI